MLELRVDRERCIGAGMCALTAPDVFDQDPDDGRVLAHATTRAAEWEQAVHEAVLLCPSGAITFVSRESSSPTRKDNE
ncbi:ferredoxin [Nocardia sp. NPDC050718]|uniref:ferredoxin n=1 Tax=Nocardia sp. NPDC050718 TaxID=3155788 RepID=UPI00340E48F0